MSAIYILWLRELQALHALAGADHRVAGAAAALSAGPRLRPGRRLSEGGPRAATCSSWRRASSRMTVLFSVDLLGHRPAVGPPVRLPEGNPRRAGAAAFRSCWAARSAARRSRSSRDAGGGRLLHRRIPSVESRAIAAGARVFMALIALVFAALGTAIGSLAEGHAGLPDGHELSGDADLLSLGRAVSAGPSAERACRSDTHGPTLVRRRRSAVGAHRRTHFGPALDAAVLIILAAAFVCLGAWRFSRIEV